MPGAGHRKNHTCTQLGGKIYLFGGYTASTGANHDDFLVIEPTKSGYRETKLKGVVGPKPAKRNGHTSNLVNEHLYVFGGWLSNAVLHDVWVFDFVRKAWLMPQTRGRQHPMLNMHISEYIEPWDMILCFGGGDGQIFENSVTCLRISSMTWDKLTAKGNVPAPRANSSSCLVGDTCYIFGGWNPDLTFYDIHLLHLPSSGASPSWSSPNVNTHPEERVGAGLAYFDGCLVLFGGQHHYDMGDLHLFDLELHRWRKCAQSRNLARRSVDDKPVQVAGDWPPRRVGHTATITSSGALLVYGGTGPEPFSGNGIFNCVFTLEKSWF